MGIVEAIIASPEKGVNQIDPFAARREMRDNIARYHRFIFQPGSQAACQKLRKIVRNALSAAILRKNRDTAGTSCFPHSNVERRAR